jgi:hypothetical protein
VADSTHDGLDATARHDSRHNPVDAARHLAKVRVAGSNPVVRSMRP